MKYSEFESIFSRERTYKYLNACGGNSRKAMTLYRYNLRLSQVMFTLVSCFEVALRNKIDLEMRLHNGNDWLRDCILPGGGLYYDRRAEGSRKIIEKAYNGLMREGRCGQHYGSQHVNAGQAQHREKVLGGFLGRHFQCPAGGDFPCEFRLVQTSDEIDCHCQYHGDIGDGEPHGVNVERGVFECFYEKIHF